ncbi:rhodanese-like domain-containing protein [Arcticibacter sp. MXS-1]|uniref:rhodanese-like domain-containing protein n=1 Tax=Arcticibacter sp. MXS-1 TaxID=3341726 RepID=UPI0035A8414A
MKGSHIANTIGKSMRAERKLPKTVLFLLSFLGVFLLSPPARSQAQPRVDTLKSTKFERKLQSKQEHTLLDARTPAEFAKGHIAGAVNINVKDSTFSAQIKTLDKSKPVYVYCRSGVRSAKAAEVLKNEGFAQIYNLKGGIQAWTKKGLPVSDSTNVSKNDKK